MERWKTCFTKMSVTWMLGFCEATFVRLRRMMARRSGMKVWARVPRVLPIFQQRDRGMSRNVFVTSHVSMMIGMAVSLWRIMDGEIVVRWRLLSMTRLVDR